MRKWTRFGVFGLIVMLLAACGSSQVTGNGKLETKSRTVAAFNRIQVNGVYRLQVRVGALQSIRITTDSNIQPLVTMQVKQGLLTIEDKSGIKFKTAKPVLIHIVTPKLISLSSSGANQLIATRINSTNFRLTSQGAVQAQVSGKTVNFLLRISGSGAINASRLVASNVNIRLTGSGQVSVNALKKLDSNIVGSGHIIYKGNPTTVLQNIMGSGTIQRVK